MVRENPPWCTACGPVAGRRTGLCSNKPLFGGISALNNDNEAAAPAAPVEPQMQITLTDPFIGLGVAGNFAGHLEQAGEAADFVAVKVDDKVAPKALFPSMCRTIPASSGLPLSGDAIFCRRRR